MREPFPMIERDAYEELGLNWRRIVLAGIISSGVLIGVMLYPICRIIISGRLEGALSYGLLAVMLWVVWSINYQP